MQSARLLAEYPEHMTEAEVLAYYKAALQINLDHYDSFREKYPSYYQICRTNAERQFAEEEGLALKWFESQRNPEVRMPQTIEDAFWKDMPDLVNEQERLAGEIAEQATPAERQALLEDNRVHEKQIEATRSRYPAALTRVEFCAYVAETLQMNISLFGSVEHSHAAMWKLIKEAIERQFAEVLRRGMEWFDEHEPMKKPERVSIEEIDAIRLEGIKRLGISFHYPFTLSPAGAQNRPQAEEIVQRATTKLQEDLRTAFDTLPPFIEDYNVLLEMGQRRMTIYRESYAESMPFITPESFAEYMQQSEQFNAYFLARIRARFVLRNTPAADHDTMGKPDVITKIRSSQKLRKFVQQSSKICANKTYCSPLFQV
jgi:hypothetical protein